MIRIRIVRETHDITVYPTAVSTEFLWIGCVVSELARAFPVANGSEPDQLACYEHPDGKVRTSTHFEGFANGVWYWINDPRTKRIPTSENELSNRYETHKCKHSSAVDSDL